LSSCLLSKNTQIKVCKTVILPVVLYGCETWSLILKEEHILRVFKNRMLRRISGPKRDEVIAGWRKLHSEELHNLYFSLNIVRMIKEDEIGGACSAYVELRNVYKILSGKPEGRHHWEGLCVDVRMIIKLILS
jgi:hypothetical protein